MMINWIMTWSAMRPNPPRELRDVTVAVDAVNDEIQQSAVFEATRAIDAVSLSDLPQDVARGVVRSPNSMT